MVVRPDDVVHKRPAWTNACDLPADAWGPIDARRVRVEAIRPAFTTVTLSATLASTTPEGARLVLRGGVEGARYLVAVGSRSFQVRVRTAPAEPERTAVVDAENRTAYVLPEE